MGQFIFSRGVGVYLLIPMQKKIHNTLVATFNIMALLYRLNKYDFSNNMSWLRWRIVFSFRWNVFSFIQINRQFSCRKKKPIWMHQLL